MKKKSYAGKVFDAQLWHNKLAKIPTYPEGVKRPSDKELVASEEAFLALCEEFLALHGDSLESIERDNRFMAGKKYVESKWKGVYNMICGACTLKLRKSQSA